MTNAIVTLVAEIFQPELAYPQALMHSRFETNCGHDVSPYPDLDREYLKSMR